MLFREKAQPSCENRHSSDVDDVHKRDSIRHKLNSAVGIIHVHRAVAVSIWADKHQLPPGAQPIQNIDQPKNLRDFRTRAEC